MPKYQRIFEILRQEIIDGNRKPGSFLPSEAELMKQYDASRDTVRKSLNQLAADGYIQKQRGKPSVVLDTGRIPFPVTGLTSFNELAQSAISDPVVTRVEVFEKIPCPKELMEVMDMSGGDVWHIERSREIDGERIILDVDYLDAQLIPDLTEEQARKSLFAYIENDLNKKVSFARKQITAVHAGEDQKRYLDLNQEDLLICVTSCNYLEDASLFQYSRDRKSVV